MKLIHLKNPLLFCQDFEGEIWWDIFEEICDRLIQVVGDTVEGQRLPIVYLNQTCKIIGWLINED